MSRKVSLLELLMAWAGILVMLMLPFADGFIALKTRIRLPTLAMLQEHEIGNVVSVQEAMVSPTKARFIRQSRRSNGRKFVEVTSRARNLNAQKVAAAKKATSAVALTRQKGMSLSYNITMQALRAYHAQHGHLVMPRRYIVPTHDKSYPQEWRGLDLSSTVYNMNWWQNHIKQRSERVVELSGLGFCWQRLQPEWNIVLEALITYSSLYGDTLVPNKFVVPHGSNNWPTATWGIPLGNCVYRIRARNDFLRDPHSAASRRDQLDGLGFVWDVQEYRFRKFYVALCIFAQLEGCGQFCRDRIQPLNVPSAFVVPETSSWPRDLWGYPLGPKCTAVRQKGIYIKNNPERQSLLDELGFHWSGNADLGWLKVVHAAAIYSKLNQRQLDVPYSFQVPSRPKDNGGDWPWPEYLWGLPLGQRLKDVRVKGAYLQGDMGEKRRRQLDALGFNWKPRRGRPRKPVISE
eukprot:scaffold2536_cov169-Amphora_coffeaeformis.AAC.21